MLVTVLLGSPHVFEVRLHGYVGIDSTGACPAGTQLVQNVPVGSAPTVGVGLAPACDFTLTAVVRYVEVTSITVTPGNDCSSTIPNTSYDKGLSPGCLVEAAATGMVLIKSGVNCGDGSEPTSGTSAVSAGFPAGSAYQCTDGSLFIVNIPVGNVPLTFTAQNGIFNPQCLPANGRVGPATPTPAPTATNTVIPTGTRTPLPTPTTTPTGTPLPSPPPSRPSGSVPADCTQPGQPEIQQTTGASGSINVVGTEAEFWAETNPPYPPLHSDITVTGHFAIDGKGIAGVAMYAQFRYAGGLIQHCDPVQTDSSGAASCVKDIDGPPAGVAAQVDVDFIANCTDFMTSTHFVPAGIGPTPTPTIDRAPAANGACLTRMLNGTVSVQASYKSPLDTQPSVFSPETTIANFPGQGPPTSTLVPMTPLPTATTTPTPTATSTPVPTPTDTPVPPPPPTATPARTLRPTSTSVPPPPPTPTPTKTTTAPRKLAFSLDAARVTRTKGKACDSDGQDFVTPRQKVCLMMFFTVRSQPRTLTRTTTYEILQNRRVVYSAEYKAQEPVAEIGKQIRYSPYTVSPSLTFGLYDYRARLQIGQVSRQRDWQFAIVRTSTIGAKPLIQGF
jgi:hypothetical protein